MKKKKILAMMLSLAVVFSFMIMPLTNEVSAEWNVKSVRYKKNITVYKTSDSYSNTYGIALGKRVKNAKKVTFKTSKKGVITNLEFFDNAAVFNAKKTGKTKLTINVKNKNGTTKKYTVNVTVKKYTSPYKSIKVGKTTYTKKLREYDSLRVKLKSKKAKISIKPKKGWKVSNLTYSAEYYGDDEEMSIPEKTYKNNAVIKFKNNKVYSESVRFTMTDKSTGLKFEYSIYISN